MPRLEKKITPIPDRKGVNPFTKGPIVIPGRPGRLLFFEVEQRGTTVFYASGGTDEETRQKRTEHPNEDEAYQAWAKALTRRRRAGFAPAGASREIEGIPAPRKGSALLLDVYFAAGDDRFVSEVLAQDSAQKLASLARPWFEDTRPFARRALLEYVDDGCDRSEHKALVKRLFKLAETANDTELMAHFMVAFDRLTRRPFVKTGFKWDPDTRQARPVFGLTADPSTREKLGEGESSSEFTRATRRYLARRAFRYFRRMGYREPQKYRAAVLLALELYRDEYLNSVGRLFSAWGLVHVLYGRSLVLTRNPKGIHLAEGRTLAELSPAPIFGAAWDGAFDELLALVSGAPSRTVRSWALGMLRARYVEGLAAIALPRVKALVLSAHEEAQVLGVELFGRLKGLESASVDDWLELLGAENVELLGAICDRAATTMSGARLTFTQCVDLAVSGAAPIAALGFSWVKEKDVKTAADLSQALRLAGAKVAAVRADAASHLAGLVRTLPFATAVHARDLCDAAHVDVRGAGLLVAKERFGEELPLWIALTESPYPDVRAFVLSHAEKFRNQPPETLARTFGAALFALTGAEADKRKAAREITARVAARPSEADRLLPLLRTTLGSIHPAERTVALVALARVAQSEDSVRTLLRSRFPELVFSTQVSE